MIEYNSQKSKLVLPEYGRNVQQMIDHCTSLESKEQRTICAKSIINIMGNLFPHLRDSEDYKHKLWDHLAIMSDFKLDIDFPYEVVSQEHLSSKPERVEYQFDKIRYMHYGKTVETMIKRALEYPEGEEKMALIMLIAYHMKKILVSVNKDGVDDEKIFKDLYYYSDGKIYLTTDKYRLRDVKEHSSQQSQNNRNRGRKRNK